MYVAELSAEFTDVCWRTLFWRMLCHGFPTDTRKYFLPDKQRPELDPDFPVWRLKISVSVIVSEKQLNSFGKEHLLLYI